MKNYTITVNGTAYSVTVEEGISAAPAAAPAAIPAPVAAAAPAPAAPAPAASGAKGSVEIGAGAAGKVWKVVAKAGQAVKAGDPVVILEAMKMEIPQVAPQDGTIVSIDCSEGQPVEAGDLLATMN